MNRKLRAFLTVAFLLLAVTTFPKQQTTQEKQETPPRPVGKLTPLKQQTTTPQKPLPCSQRLNVQIDTNAELSKKVVALQVENEAWRNLANDLTAKQQEAADKIDQLLKQKIDLLDKEAQLLKHAQNEHDLGLNQGMLLNDVSGTWKIQNGNSGTGGVCSVRVTYESRTIVLSNCRY